LWFQLTLPNIRDVLIALLLFQTALAGAPCQDVVCVEVEKTGKAVTFYATSRADGVSITFSASAVNMVPASPPVLVRTLSQGRTELMTLRAIPGKRPLFDHGFFWEWGVVGATHDDRVSYRLPFERHKTFWLFQGPDGALSHKGQFAWDFPMPLGTPVCAARAGTVIEVVDEFGEGGGDEKFGPLANRILILHEDGTIGAYFHLLRGGMRTKFGDRVETGAVIGTSGNSGRSTGPHLHFEVYRKLEPGCRETLPVRFRTADGDGIVLEPGKSYRAD
jgi:murein DD-endopeptidase MepM/ murein hydrolase activator NlpD